MKLKFSRQFFPKNTQIPNFIKVRPVGAELFHADRRTDGHGTKLVVIFRKFTNAPKNTSGSSRCPSGKSNPEPYTPKLETSPPCAD